MYTRPRTERHTHRVDLLLCCSSLTDITVLDPILASRQSKVGSRCSWTRTHDLGTPSLWKSGYQSLKKSLEQTEANQKEDLVPCCAQKVLEDLLQLPCESMTDGGISDPRVRYLFQTGPQKQGEAARELRVTVPFLGLG